MPYRYLEAIATADVAFQAWGKSIEELFAAAAEATMNVMVERLATIERHETVSLVMENDDPEMLLFDFLGELVYLKDARQLLLRVQNLAITDSNGMLELAVTLTGERIDPSRHPLNVDVKAVTLHLFEVVQSEKGWQSTVVLDV